MLEICMLGAFDVSRDGVPVEGVHNRRANRLLALLILEEGRRVGRDWIEQVLEMSYDALRKAESTLRACLGPDRCCITVANNSLLIDYRNMAVDVFEFENLVALGDEESLCKAIQLYGGGLLKDWDFGWLLEKREELQVSYLDALQTLIRMAIKDREYVKACSLLRRFTHVYPNMDYAWGQLIEMYRIAGQNDEANLVYSKYVAGLEARARAEQRVIRPSQRVTEALTSAPAVASLIGSCPNPSTVSMPPCAYFEPVGGAVPLNSPYYIRRATDDLAATALAPQTSFILIKGAKRVGKSSLLARLLQDGRRKQANVILTDLQNITQSDMETPQTFLCRVAEDIASQLGVEIAPCELFDSYLPPTINFERFMLRHVLKAVNGWLIWGVDETDRLFDCNFKDDVFGMMRTWHNKRSLDPGTDWELLTVMLSYATDAHLIQNLNQSPFNVGFPVEMTDFTMDQVAELNRRYGEPLRNSNDLNMLYNMVGGHPFLARQCLLEMSLRRWSINEVLASATQDRGILRAHLERMRLALLRDPEVTETVRTWLRSGALPDANHYARLCAAGVMNGDKPADMQFRCGLYEQYFRRVFM